MPRKTNEQERWAARTWLWLKGIDTSEDGDPDLQSEEVWRKAPTRALAEAHGRKLAKHPRAMSSECYDLMRGTPDGYGGWDWQKVENE
jgi:hypothetical protein